jgi:hypothetical protein
MSEVKFLFLEQKPRVILCPRKKNMVLEQENADAAVELAV